MRKQKPFFNLMAILAIFISAFGNVSNVAYAENGKDAPKADPRLLQIA